eukprot:CAMPEP_0206257218 /NCGR_PEP_ID=MMETSP0047_2-20121206/25212_1 /ASSEMBLY_ACC=CAM_ASM_000192 /TAXON_ID=195065 /ORGANISM="Chroomonas mesostigmatica_cf, Strain CCMP1168" /LENGTH=177 /DNA_ID=CAMNT_0053683767 /DNA_START=179 /DNA_END=709 /DNA_ORIENTATION=+
MLGDQHADERSVERMQCDDLLDALQEDLQGLVASLHDPTTDKVQVAGRIRAIQQQIFEIEEKIAVEEDSDTELHIRRKSPTVTPRDTTRGRHEYRSPATSQRKVAAAAMPPLSPDPAAQESFARRGKAAVVDVGESSSAGESTDEGERLREQEEEMMHREQEQLIVMQSQRIALAGA